MQINELNNLDEEIGDLLNAKEIQKDVNNEVFEDQLYEGSKDSIDNDVWLDDNGMSETEATTRVFDINDCGLFTI